MRAESGMVEENGRRSRAPGPRGVDLGIAGCEQTVEIGRGGFSTVYRAWQPEFGRTVAVKILSTGSLDADAQRRFDRELRAMGALSGHPHIVTVYSKGLTASGNPYLIMGFEPGGSLADRLRRLGPMAWQDAVAAGIRVAGALETAHRAGVLHRDVKPGNILLSAFDEPKLADFGIAQVHGTGVTQNQGLAATLSHAAPELLAGLRPTVASDVYALASTVHALIRGCAPFAEDGDEDGLAMIVRISTQPVPSLRPSGVPPPVCRVLERAMAKSPANRPPSALELGRELQRAGAGAGSAQPAPLVLEIDGARGDPVAGSMEVVGRPVSERRSDPSTDRTGVLRRPRRFRGSWRRMGRRGQVVTAVPVVGLLVGSVVLTTGVLVHRPSAVSCPAAIVSASPSPAGVASTIGPAGQPLSALSGSPSWVARRSLSPARELLAVTTGKGRDGLIYAIGGSDGRPNQPPLSTVEAYNPRTDSWEKRRDLSIGRLLAAATTAPDGRIFVIGGIKRGQDANAVLDSVEVYTPAADWWVAVAPLHTPRYGAAAVTTADGRIWAVGGSDKHGVALSSVEVYDPSTGDWLPGPALKTPRAALAAVARRDGPVYAIGGGNQDVDLATVEVCSPGSASWEKAATLPGDARSGLAAAGDAADRIYAIGGFHGANAVDTVYLLAFNRWVQAPPLRVARAAAATAGVDGQIYAVGGLTTGGHPDDTLEAYPSGAVP